MHSFRRRSHRSSGEASAETAPTTKGLILGGGWRYDLHGWFVGTFLFRGKGRVLRRRTASLASLRPGEQVLDVGCGTGTLALEAQRRVGTTGRVVGIDPGAEQIVQARVKAARHHMLVEFQIGAIEQMSFPDQTFDVVLSTLMMHHLPAGVRRQGLAEIARVLKPGGRLVIADFTRKQDRRNWSTRFHAGGSAPRELVTLVEEAGFVAVETEEMRSSRFSAFPGASLVRAYKR